MSHGSGGQMNRREAQTWADEIRSTRGTAARWDQSQRVRFLLACIPLLVVVVLGIAFL